ncbi:tripeptidyl peptidase A [Amylocystis lapponica]|nr:tripeptidyl peptidase A [Amylocystis lapponica]
MRPFSWLRRILALGFAVHATAAPSGSGSKLKESISHPRGWSKVAPAHPDHGIELRIGLPQPNFDELETHLYEVSDPFHERYGAHLSKEDVELLVAPHPESIDAVNEWLAAHGIFEQDITRSPAKDWVTVVVPVKLAEKMLDTEYHVWVHDDTGHTLVRTTAYSLPETLHTHIDVIQPTTAFSRFTNQATTYRFSESHDAVVDPNVPYISVLTASGGRVNASCNATITVQCLKELYNAVGYVPAGSKNGNRIAITAYLEQYANLRDLHLFYEDQVPAAAAANSSFSVVSINGGLNNQSTSAAGVEANLDTQFAFGLTYPTDATFYTTGGRPPINPFLPETSNTNEPYAQWLAYVLSQKSLPQTISTSYADDETSVPYSYAKRVCRGFAELGARGVSLTFSSGDGGVGDGDPDPATQTCFTAQNTTAFEPLFPPSCPYVTAVGGTTHVPEVAFRISGGGFSNYFARPWYEEFAVPPYLEALAASGVYQGRGLYNASGRAYPDVAAQSDDFRIFYEGTPGLVAGTSAAAPTVAGIISLLNDARLSAGLPPLGFLNPLIYAIGSLGLAGFNDITVGNNPGCGTEGFNATVGWDPVTGWGHRISGG